MKKTQFIDLITTIRKTAVSFIAITVFITLGLAFYGGTSWGVEHTENSLNQTYSDCKMQSLLVTDLLGLDEDQISRLTEIEGIDDAEGFRVVYRFFRNKEGVKQQAAVVSITERLNQLMNVEGELPAEAGQAAVLRSWAETNDVSIGDVIVFQDEDVSDLTVTAIVDSSVYLSTNPYAHGICSDNGLYIDAAFFVCEQDLNPENLERYAYVALYSEELDGLSRFTDEYKARSEELCEEVQTVVSDWDQQILKSFGAYQQVFSSVTEISANSSFLTADNLIGVLGSLRSVLGITFMAIGILICYSVVSRLIADGVVQIGTRKALGFFNSEILRLYLCYSGAAALLGGLLGALVGVFGIEYAFVQIFAGQFTFSQIPLIFDIMDVLPVFLIMCGAIFTVTIVACAGETGKNAMDLLQRAFKDGRSQGLVLKSKILRKMSLLNQTVFQNLLRDKRRVFGMIMGIAGSTALITAGLTFYANFATAFSIQFEDYYCYDYQICYEATSEKASEEIRRVLDDYGLTYAEVYSSSLILHTPDGKTNAPNVIVPVSTEELAKVLHFDTNTGTAEAYDGGLWMSEYYRYAFDGQVGSLLDLQTLDGKEAEIPVDKYYKHHLSTPVVFMDAATYSEAFGEDPAPNTFYVASGGLELKQLRDELEGIDGYIYAYNSYDSYLASYSSEEIVVMGFAAIFVLMAVLMGLMTLVNQLNVYVSEKKNELIIIIINGYDRKYAKRYIYQDTIILTVIGILIGVIFGSILGDRALVALEGSSLRLLHSISFLSCGAGAVVTAVITALICRRALRRVDKFRLADIDTMR